MQQVLDFIKKHDKFAVVTHVSPDGDAIGSAFSLACVLHSIGKKAEVVLLTKLSSLYNFEEFAPLYKTIDKADFSEYEACISVDCADERRLSGAREGFFSVPNMNIDHHVSNTEFAEINYVQNAPSTGEIIYDIAKALGAQIDNVARMAIYIAISTDTGNFTYKNTTANSLRVCSELLESGLDVNSVANQIYNTRSLGATKLISKFIQNISLHHENKMTLATLTLQELEETGAEQGALESLISYAISVETAEIAAFIREIDKNTYKVSLRSKHYADVGKLVAAYGGGGHKHAAGCAIKGNIDDIKAEILKVAGEYLR